MQSTEIAFATIGKDGKDDTCLSLGSQEMPSQEAPEIEFATIGKDGKDDSRLSMGSRGSRPSTQSPIIQL
ncbi:MAG: hypothetical protein HC902_03140 [Calothrix sp. SM1_5_4]|nr:hypothetical protein [Calothrix sp. SM1_5_4]